MAEEQGVITARLGIFSGRENPVIAVQGEMQERFADLVKRTRASERGDPPRPPKLGEFHGFTVTVPQAIARAQDLPASIEVRAGVVSAEYSGTVQHWPDSVGLSDFLIGLSYEQGHGELLGRLGIEPGKGSQSGAKGD